MANNQSDKKMTADRPICLCFHVSYRKVQNWLRVEKPQRAAQLSECYGAGTGCGWCRKYLVELFEASQAAKEPKLPDIEDYESERKDYIRAGKGTPPTP
jgi:bacterioferritin-associated ferredoxin